MRLVSTFFLVLLLSNLSFAQKRIGYLISVDDSLNHRYIGLTAFQIVQKKYQNPDNLDDFTSQRAQMYLSMLSRDSLVKIDEVHFRDYIENKKTLKIKDFKEFERSWFGDIQKTYNISSLIVFKNADSFADNIYWSKFGIDGYGLYNGAYKRLNSAYFRLQGIVFYISSKSDVKSAEFVGNDYYRQNKNFPRVTKEEDTLSQEERLKVITPIKELIDIQFRQIFSDPYFQKYL